MIKNKKRLLPAAITLIILANFFVWGYVIIKKQKYGDTAIRNSNRGIITKKIKLPGFKLEDNKGKVITPDNLAASLNILIFFTFDDCASCLYEAEFWGEAAKDFRGADVKILGFTDERDVGGIQEFRQEYGILFPVLIDRDGRLREKILSKLESARISFTTPFKVFVNINHEIIYIEGSVKDAGEQKLFSTRVSGILQKFLE
ncbi:MAG: TlpA family protein disulfide reductase [Candidatus Aminicenantes bacterium]|nr:TlpA family protein disulfide reductase [Candidatus Aminicenantes bacterium]